MGAGGSESADESYKLGAGACSPNLAVHRHLCLKSEISVVFGCLKAAVDELPKETVEHTHGTLTEAVSLPPIYWEFVLPQLDKGVRVHRSGMAYVLDDPDEQDSMDSMPDVDNKPKGTPKPKASKPKPKKGTASNPPGVDAAGSAEHQATPTKEARSPLVEAPAAQDDEEQTQQQSQQLVTPHKGNTHPVSEPKGQSPSPEGLENFANLVSGGTALAAQPQKQPQKGIRLGNKLQR